jgi:Reverse transcriptase (RNA-dependent DNA polymerase)
MNVVLFNPMLITLYSHITMIVFIVILIYVDDLVVTCNDSEALDIFKAYLSSTFHMKDLGALKYFLGIEIARSPIGLFLCQHKYTLDIMAECGLLGTNQQGFRSNKITYYLQQRDLVVS